MAVKGKILIIEDQIKMIRIMRDFLHKINTGITENNIYCFNENIETVPLSCIQDWDKTECNIRIKFSGQKDAVIEKIFKFFRENNTENILVITDVLLITDDISAPTYEKYMRIGEFSAEIYAEILKAVFVDDIKDYHDRLDPSIKCQKKMQEEIKVDIDKYTGVVDNQGPMNPEKVFSMLYSRSPAIASIITDRLNDFYDDGKLDGLSRDYCLPESIALCKNRYELTDNEKIVRDKQSGEVLALPDEFLEFIEKELLENNAE